MPSPLKATAKKLGRQLHNHFIPHEGNDYIPRALKHEALFAYSIILLTIKVLVIVLPIALPSVSLYSSAITAPNLIQLTNQTRKNLGLAELSENQKLMQAARQKAEDMLVQQYFAHISPGGVTPWAWIKGVGYAYQYAGENLAVHYIQAEDVQEGWLASPGHRENILSPRYSEIGIGIATGTFQGVPTIFVVQMFGRPARSALALEPKPVAPATAPAPARIVSPPTAPAPQTPVNPAPQQSPQVESIQVNTPLSAPENIDRDSADLSATMAPAPAAPAELPPPALSPPRLEIKSSTLAVVPHGFTYEVQIAVANAQEVVLQLDSQWAPLTRQDPSELWRGTIAYDPRILRAGAQLHLAATGATPEQKIIQPLAWVAPQAKTQDFYIFTEGTHKTATFLKFIVVSNLRDFSTQFYLYTIIFLSVALFLSVMIKFEIQRHSVTAHTLFVIAIALILSLI